MMPVARVGESNEFSVYLFSALQQVQGTGLHQGKLMHNFLKLLVYYKDLGLGLKSNPKEKLFLLIKQISLVDVLVIQSPKIVRILQSKE